MFRLHGAVSRLNVERSLIEPQNPLYGALEWEGVVLPRPPEPRLSVKGLCMHFTSATSQNTEQLIFRRKHMSFLHVHFSWANLLFVHAYSHFPSHEILSRFDIMDVPPKPPIDDHSLFPTRNSFRSNAPRPKPTDK